MPNTIVDIVRRVSAIESRTYVDVVMDHGTPPRPDAGTARLFTSYDNTTGKVQLSVIFPSGDTQILASEA